MKMKVQITAAVFAILIGLPVGIWAENGDWPHWRGPENNGISSETGLPASWSATENVKWRLALPGSAPSTPVIWGERIFLTSADGDAMALLCVDSNGKILWQKPLGERRSRFYQADSHTG